MNLIGISNALVLMLFRMPHGFNDDEFLRRLYVRLGWRYLVIMAAAGLSFGLIPWAHESLGWLLFILFGCAPPLLVWLSLRSLGFPQTTPNPKELKPQVVRRTTSRESLLGVLLGSLLLVGVPAIWILAILLLPREVTSTAHGLRLIQLSLVGLRKVLGYLLVAAIAVALSVNVIGALGLLLSRIWLLLRPLFSRICDHYLLARIRRDRFLELAEFINVCISLQTPECAAAFFRSVRRGGRLNVDADVHHAVASLLLVAQSQSIGPAKAILDQIPGIQRPKRLGVFASTIHSSPDAISELALLVEQLQPEQRVLREHA